MSAKKSQKKKKPEEELRKSVTELRDALKESGVKLGSEVVAHLQRVNQLLSAVRALADRDIIMPVEEIRLAAQLAEEAGTEKLSQDSVIFPLMVLMEDPNFHVRRVAVSACRRIKRFDNKELVDLLLKKLKDPHPWVRYDAVWAFEEAGLRSPNIIKALKKVAAGTKVPTTEQEEKMDRGDAELMARVRAAKALEKMGEKV